MAKGNKENKNKLDRGQSTKTIDHEVIRKWVEERGGKPAAVKNTTDTGDAGLLRIDYPERAEEDALEDITWEEFFEKFEEKKLAFLYQEETSKGDISRFSKLVERDKL